MKKDTRLMDKKMDRRLIIFLVLMIAFFIAVVAIGEYHVSQNQYDEEEKKDPEYDGSELVGAYFNNVTYTYDGTEKEIVMQGKLPNGASVEYTDNKATLPGVYRASAKVVLATGEEYNFVAKLTIESLTFEGIEFKSMSVTYDGNMHSIYIEGDIPDGSTIKYTYNNEEIEGVTEVGSYKVICEISKENYITKTYYAMLYIRES